MRRGQLAERLNEESRAERKRKDEASDAMLRDLAAMTDQIKRRGPHAKNRPHTRASTGQLHQPGQVIDAVAVYAFRNHGVQPVAVSTTPAAPRTFAAIGTQVYGNHAPSFLIASTPRGGRS